MNILKYNKFFLLLFSIFCIFFYCTICIIVFYLFSQFNPIINLANSYKNGLIYFNNYNSCNKNGYSFDETKAAMYKYVPVYINDEYYVKVVMNSNALDYGIAINYDYLFIIDTPSNLIEGCTYTNNDNFSNYATLIKYDNININNDLIKCEFEPTFIQIDNTISKEESNFIIIEEDNVLLIDEGEINNMFQTYFAYSSNEYKNYVFSVIDSKCHIIICASLLCFLGLYLAFNNIIKDHLDRNKKTIIIKALYNQSRLKCNLENSYLLFIFSIPIIIISCIISTLIFNCSMKLLFTTLISFSLFDIFIIYIIVYNYTKKTLKKISIRESL